MRSINIIALILALTSTVTLAQQKSESNQSRKIEINNLKGELSISFDDGEITEFNINGEPVAQDLYDNFQNLIDQFGEDIEINVTPPTPPNTPRTDDNKSETLFSMIIDYLMEEGAINSFSKFDVKLKRKYLKVNGKKVSNIIHQECLDFFNEIYGHRLNFESHVKLKRNGDKSTSSISIVD